MDSPTSATKRIVNYHISRLQDKSRDVRLKAIAELALLPDTDALNALRSVFENDEDVEVRRAAQEAGRAVFVKIKEQDDGSVSS
ncbi:MAG: HEAT repeat domain-containing protein [Anaerolineae bacterium]|nr:HEAT repeat domain-containing protein [Anaerolineae bacterium]